MCNIFHQYEVICQYTLINQLVLQTLGMVSLLWVAGHSVLLNPVLEHVLFFIFFLSFHSCSHILKATCIILRPQRNVGQFFQQISATGTCEKNVFFPPPRFDIFQCFIFYLDPSSSFGCYTSNCTLCCHCHISDATFKPHHQQCHCLEQHHQ